MKSKYSINEAYKAYLDQRAKTKKYLNRMGLNVEREAMNKYQFEITFQAQKQGYKDRGINAPSNLKVAQELARNDYYEKTNRQAKVLKEAYQNAGIRPPSIAVLKVTGMTTELSSTIKAFRKEKRDAGMSNKDISIAVSSYFFGSP